MSAVSRNKYKACGFGTKSIHAGQSPNPVTGAVMPGIELSSTFAQKSPGAHQRFLYSRISNPTREIMENLIAAVENGKYGIAFGSGCAATASTTSILETGSHIFSIDDVYGGTHNYFRNIAEKVNGMKVTFVPISGKDGPRNFRKALEKCSKTIHIFPKMLWIETPTNPMLKIADIAKLTAIAHEYNMIVVVDNTFGTPFNQTPLDYGVDIVVHSITKYLNGHSDVVMGIAITNSSAIYEKLRFVQTAIGAVPAPFDCYMVIRGMKTLQLRMEKHAQNTMAVAQMLEKHSKIERVFYPHLKSHPDFDIAKKQMKTGGGMVTFLLKGGMQESKDFLVNLQLFILAGSLGAVECLAEHPAKMTHACVPAKRRKEIGIFDNLIRLSVGIEDIEDIIYDIRQALNCVNAKPNYKSKL